MARVYWWQGGVTIMAPQRYWRGRAQARILMVGRTPEGVPREMEEASRVGSYGRLTIPTQVQETFRGSCPKPRLGNS